MNNSEKIRFRIELERQELNRLAQRYGMRHARVLHQSVVLDRLLNKYSQVIYSNYRRRKPIA
ncbi:aspartyl-phosphate phosphatase Spo0E family protein [Paenibacillus phoenicis]|uniref:Aspartyl-phosphate phosphatase Spo0E family protein n=1 Tax=Paenibacillus phoenicis TaxID=554117 RepID=A0ABU5PQT2_9BACL|nr:MULTISPECIES: aspartyl-phosphate phosphatase Spo0E family protein [Paenibacillus]EES74093.1 Spo0E like sporulation regulatory protein [Paenibacillus sp. oral taxon 786 str. D14]MEA3572172.1 aspartyl-phosphate phosphatase Spo0E family protein [Paenibacillus phoenicis]